MLWETLTYDIYSADLPELFPYYMWWMISHLNGEVFFARNGG